MLINGDEIPVAILPGVVGPELCDALLAELAPRPLATGQTATGTGRRSRVTFLPDGHWSAGLLFELACRANGSVGWHVELTAPEAPQLAVYAAREHYDWHVDVVSHGDRVRKLSVVLQLDPPGAYTGGELQLSRFGMPTPTPIELPAATRDRGTVLVFPSYQLHRVTPVVTGERRALVCWILGPRYV